MKKALLLIAVLAAALSITYLLLHQGSSAGKPEKKDNPLSVTSGSSGFQRSFSNMMNDYYQLSDAFVEWDTAVIRSCANKLSVGVDSLKLNQLKADSAIILTAISLKESIMGEIAGLNGESVMEQKKREFNMVTDMLYNLIRTVRYNGSIIYHMMCPMAFGDSSEGFWLSPTRQVVNPYLGKKHPKYSNKMLDCGKVIDSIHFAITP